MPKTKIFLAGDSTIAFNDITSYPQTGWGQVINLYLKDYVCVKNYAKNGRSSKSFINEGLLDEIDAHITENDILLIQFGHNDQKEDDTKRTEPFTSYQYYLSQYIEVAKKHNAYPVLITPLYRRYFNEDGSIMDNVHFDFPTAMIELAHRLDVPYIDLCHKSKQLYEKLGDRHSKALFMHLPKNKYKNYPDGIIDDTHLNYEGAVTIAGLVSEGLKELGHLYNEIVK
ncbi:lysophospholipase L1-like esterase [Natranaerovirga hydrolytica]|uniref:Lysophospholipase L1-like esterase n=1 Tax=Natranaerovirga hydrolytica TaxID=680378 RepID=A0A4R1MK41_9FIRM|nr:rhamnogalacturonan acetylesterase [Natranaerovirga hydrolytica]TCK92835.1 lysophospholipase L1-like esterase [Natranaerovirga hydrolytica]